MRAGTVLLSIALVACASRTAGKPTEATPEQEPEHQPVPKPERAPRDEPPEPLADTTLLAPPEPCNALSGAPPYGVDRGSECLPPPADPSLRGSLRDSDVAQAVRSAAPSFRPCILQGSAVVRVVVEADGRVRSASLYRDRLTGARSIACFLHAVEAIRFPAPGEPAELIVPFVFRTGPSDAGARDAG